LQQISDISIDASEVNLSIMNDSMGSIDPAKLRRRSWKFHLQNLFTYGDEPNKFLLFWGLVSLSVVVVFYGFKFSENLMSGKLFLTSYSEWGAAVNTFDPLTEVEPFFDNPRFAKNLMTMTKMVTNIKPSENSGNNPMLAIEINIEGMSSEAIIEIKDREAEFKDILLRIAEETAIKPFKFTDAQEDIFATHPKSLYLLLLLGAGIPVSEAGERMGISDEELEKCLYSLDRVNAIELGSEGKVRILARGPYQWNAGGPLHQKYQKKYLSLLSDLAIAPTKENAMKIAFELYLSDRLLEQMQKELKTVYEKYRSLSRLEHEIEDSKKIWPAAGMILVTRFDLWKALTS
ncbi:MAG: hypothetical protein V4692_02580, partial [Bdellovibrionota bacterium]